MIRICRAVSSVGLFGLMATGCSSPAPADGSLDALSDAGSVEVQVQFDGPVRRGQNALSVRLSTRDAAQVPPLLAAVDALMPAHGHEAHAQQIVELDDVFHATELDLFMTGRWQIELELSSGEVLDRVSFPVDVP